MDMLSASTAVSTLSTDCFALIVCFHNIRELTRRLISIQMEGCSEEELLQAQKALNEKYDSYVKEYGVITISVVSSSSLSEIISKSFNCAWILLIALDTLS